MPLAKRRSAYAAEEEILNTVLARGEPMTFECPRYGDAVNLRRRMYYFRQLAAQDGEKKYDRIKITLEKGSRILHFDFVRPVGILKTLSGDEVPVIIPPPKEDQEVARIVNRLDQWVEQGGVDLSILGDDDDEV